MGEMRNVKKRGQNLDKAVISQRRQDALKQPDKKQ